LIFYFLSKFIPLIFSPIGIVFILLLLFLFNDSRKLIYSSIFFLYIFSSGYVSNFFLKLVEYPWERINIAEIDYADAIVVLSDGGKSSPPGNTNIIEWSDPDRFDAGIELFKKGKAKKIFFTGGINPYNKTLPPEGDVHKQRAKKLGLNENNFTSTSNVNNTFQEAIKIKILLESGYNFEQKKIILVTSAFHMNRAKKVFEKQNFVVTPFPVDFKSKKNYYRESFYSPYKFIPNSQSLNDSSLAIREIIGRIFYHFFK